MNLKKRILIPVGILLFAAIIVVPAILLFKGISEFSVANQDLNRSVQELRSLYDKDPFPSAPNIQQENKNVEAMHQWFERLLAELRNNQILEEASTPTGFITQYGHIRNGLMKRAGRQTVDDNFAFGFERYADGSLPAPVDVARLMQQLRIIEQVATLFIESGVKQITEIKREEFESAGTGASEEAPEGAASRRRAGSRRSSRATPAASAQEPQADGLHRKQHFSVRIMAHEVAVIEALNRLAAHKMFMVVTDVDFKKTQPDLQMPKAEEADGGTLAPDAPAKPKPVSEEDEPRQNRRVSGSTFDVPMDVTIDFDVYTFNAGASE
jgi:hypothetical protein